MNLFRVLRMRRLRPEDAENAQNTSFPLAFRMNMIYFIALYKRLTIGDVQ